MDKENIIMKFQDTLSNFQELISSFNEKQINQVPFEGSWTVGQVAQHIIMANSGFVEVLNGLVKDSNRDADMQISGIRDIFLNFDTKFESPDFILPLLKDYDRGRLLKALEMIKVNITKVIDELDLSKVCVSFELPGFGYLTRLEAIHFVIYHTQRHAHQLSNIKAKIQA